MFIVQPRNRVWGGLLFVSLLGSLLCTGATARAQPQEKSDKGAEIKTLLKERQALLEKVVTQLTAQYKTGTVDFSKLAQAELDALKATLDVVDGTEKRTAAFQQYQKTAEAIVRLTEGRFKVGACTEVDVFQAKAILLAVRIELLREEQKAKLRK